MQSQIWVEERAAPGLRASKRDRVALARLQLDAKPVAISFDFKCADTRTVDGDLPKGDGIGEAVRKIIQRWPDHHSVGEDQPFDIRQLGNPVGSMDADLVPEIRKI